MLPIKESHDIGYVNYYQYPPMHSLNEADRELLLDGFDLEAVESETPYTLFVSVPYCRVRCHSCPFYKGLFPRKNADKVMDRYLDLIEAQASYFSRAQRFSNGHLRAIYLGGGTASVLSPRQIDRLVSFLKRQFPIQPETEITLEGNPSDFTESYLAAARTAGVTRVSLGYQSSHEEILRQALNSPHTSDQGLSAIKTALKTGFYTVNVDLLFRTPSQTLDLWEQDIELMIALSPQSITMNEYVVHGGSASEKLISRGRLPAQIESAVAYKWYTNARERLLGVGYKEQRIGTFTLPGHEQIYGKLSYSQNTDCIGLGVGAYGFVNRHLYGVSNNLDEFAHLLTAGFFPAADRASHATSRNVMERWIFFALLKRTIDRATFAARFGCDVTSEFPVEIQRLERQRLLLVTPQAISLTELGVQHRNTVLYTFYSAG